MLKPPPPLVLRSPPRPPRTPRLTQTTYNADRSHPLFLYPQSQAPANGRVTRSSYRTVSKSSNVDESLFGSQKPGTMRGGKAQVRSLSLPPLSNHSRRNPVPHAPSGLQHEERQHLGPHRRARTYLYKTYWRPSPSVVIPTQMCIYFLVKISIRWPYTAKLCHIPLLFLSSLPSPLWLGLQHLSTARETNATQFIAGAHSYKGTPHTHKSALTDVSVPPLSSSVYFFPFPCCRRRRHHRRRVVYRCRLRRFLTSRPRGAGGRGGARRLA